MLLVGVFVGIIVGIILLGDLVGDGESAEAGGAHSMIEERIQPVGQVAVTGGPAPAPASAPIAVAQVPAVAAAAPAQAAAPGSAIYEQACALCHVPPGLAGAPAFGDAASWAPRIAQGPDVLAEHVINGYQGSTGVMPPKGGRVDLSDEDVLAAMQYMIDAAGQ
ncbi:MAG: cytochrome c5 family protein [Gammaproteobacteria bacterium]|nr:cytochrome c5 family protein [Gammaproteobacteria bacterium]